MFVVDIVSVCCQEMPGEKLKLILKSAAQAPLAGAFLVSGVQVPSLTVQASRCFPLTLVHLRGQIFKEKLDT